MRTKIYIAGPVSGLPNYNHHAFVQAAHEVHALGFDAINPHTLCRHANPDDWHACLKICLHHLVLCNGIYMLKGWQNSRGATLERSVAMQLNIPVHYSLDELGQLSQTIYSQLINQ